jgi:hypothetical protein
MIIENGRIAIISGRSPMDASDVDYHQLFIRFRQNGGNLRTKVQFEASESRPSRKSDAGKWCDQTKTRPELPTTKSEIAWSVQYNNLLCTY